MVGGEYGLAVLCFYYALNENDGVVLEFNDLLQVHLHGDNLQAFLSAWEDTLLGMREVPSDDLLHDLFHAQLMKSESLKHMMALYRMDQVQRGHEKSYERLMTMLHAEINEQRRASNRDSMDKAHQRRLRGPGEIPQ